MMREKRCGPVIRDRGFEGERRGKEGKEGCHVGVVQTHRVSKRMNLR